MTQSSRIGPSGRLASLFLGSKLTPLIILGSLLLGLLAVVLTPREEEPQIIVPMADVFLPFPGASSQIVEAQLTKPIERKISEIKGVEYVYSMSKPGGALIIVRFYVGEPMEQSLVDLYDKLMSNQDSFPPGAGPFLVKPRAFAVNMVSSPGAVWVMVAPPPGPVTACRSMLCGTEL